MEIRNILFDLDGTLTDPKPGIINCIRYALNRMGRDVKETQGWEQYIGPPLLSSLAELLQTEDMAIARQALEFYRERFSRKGLFENRVYPAIKELLVELQRSGHTLFVATSKPQVFACRIIDHFRLDKYFQGVYGSELDGTRVGKGDLIRHLVQAEKLSAEYTVMVGDRKYDIVGAKTAGLSSMGVLWGYGSRRELEAAEADWLCSRPAGVQEICLGQG